MILLLADENIQNYDIIAIQEPWRNLSAPITLSPHQSGFYLFYRLRGDIRVCFYINDVIDLESWEVEYPSSDICTLKIVTSTSIKSASETIHIHNIYNPSLFHYNSVDSPSTLAAIKEQLKADTHYILLGDFNLHHLFWNDSLRSTHHLAADQLLEIADVKNLLLTLPKGTIT